MDQICSRCGSRGFHYNRVTMRLECDACGHPLRDQNETERLMQFDRTLLSASRHLQAGNWDQTINLIRPLLNDYPTETKLYEMMLQAATKDFTDISMQNNSMRNTASNAWDKLVRLGAVTPVMKRYSSARFKLHREELIRIRNKILLFIFLAAFLLFNAGSTRGTAPFLSILLLAGAGWSIYKATQLHPISVIRPLTKSAPDPKDNPFT